MKSTIALLCLSTVLLQPATLVVAQNNVQVIMQPNAVSLPLATSQWFYATMSDGSPIMACEWTATGVGQNGVSMFYVNNYGSFNTGILPAVTYYISCICTNNKGVTAQGYARVDVHK